MREAMTRSRNGWVGHLSVTRNIYIPNTSRGTRTSLITHSQGTSTYQISPSQKNSTPFYHLRQRHNSTSNFHPEILSSGYFHYQHPQHDRVNRQSYCNQAVWQLVKTVQIPHTHRHREQIPGRNSTRIKDNPGVIICSISAKKPVWRNT